MASSCFIASLCLSFIFFNPAPTFFVAFAEVSRGIPIIFLGSSFPPLPGLPVQIIRLCLQPSLLCVGVCFGLRPFPIRLDSKYSSRQRHRRNDALICQRHHDLFGLLHILRCPLTTQVAIGYVSASFQVRLGGSIGLVQPSKTFSVIGPRPFSQVEPTQFHHRVGIPQFSGAKQ